jgi:hypothetical protein
MTHSLSGRSKLPSPMWTIETKGGEISCLDGPVAQDRHGQPVEAASQLTHNSQSNPVRRGRSVASPRRIASGSPPLRAVSRSSPRERLTAGKVVFETDDGQPRRGIRSSIPAARSRAIEVTDVGAAIDR